MVEFRDLDQYAWDGIQSLLDDYAKLEVGDDIYILYTPSARMAASWVALACRERGFFPGIIPMLPLVDPSFEQRLRVIPATRVSRGRCVVFSFENGTMSHNGAIRKHFCAYEPNSLCVIRAINSDYSLFATGLSATPDEMSQKNTTILERCRGASQIVVKTPGGTDLHASLDNRKFSYKSSRGIIQPGMFMVIPAGEVATFPANINGILVADFAINVNMRYDGNVQLEKSPVKVKIADGILKDLFCEDATVNNFLQKCFSMPNSRRIGEIGFGTNSSVISAVKENSHLNERVPGIHLGFGQHNQTDAAAGYTCDIHVDLCARGGIVWFDDGGRLLDLENVPRSKNPHPRLISSEDVVSADPEDDCCGILR